MVLVTCSSTAFGQLTAGSCGYYNGANSSNYADVIIPEIMRAAAANNNPDFAGSCGRYLKMFCLGLLGNSSTQAA